MIRVLLRKPPANRTRLVDFLQRLQATSTYLYFFPAQQADGTISAPTLFRNIQRTWDERQEANNVKAKNSFLEAVSGTIDWDYYAAQARTQYIDNPDENVDIVVFGHTHVPAYQE